MSGTFIGHVGGGLLVRYAGAHQAGCQVTVGVARPFPVDLSGDFLGEGTLCGTWDTPDGPRDDRHENELAQSFDWLIQERCKRHSRAGRGQ